MSQLTGVESPSVERLLGPEDGVVAAGGHAHRRGQLEAARAAPTYGGGRQKAGRRRLVPQLVEAILSAGVHHAPYRANTINLSIGKQSINDIQKVYHLCGYTKVKDQDLDPY